MQPTHTDWFTRECTFTGKPIIIIQCQTTDSPVLSSSADYFCCCSVLSLVLMLYSATFFLAAPAMFRFYVPQGIMHCWSKSNASAAFGGKSRSHNPHCHVSPSISLLVLICEHVHTPIAFVIHVSKDIISNTNKELNKNKGVIIIEHLMEHKSTFRASAWKAIKMNCTACQFHWAGCGNSKRSKLL